MRSDTDALRSIAKYLAEGVLAADDFEVRFAVEEGTFRRPFCRVGFAGPSAKTTPTARHTDTVVPVALHLWPVEKPTVEEAIMEALRVEGLLTRAFTVGAASLPNPADAPDVDPIAGALAPATYAYVVAAIDRVGETLPSPEVEATIAGGPAGLALSWTAVPGAIGYRVYRDDRLVAVTRHALWEDDGSITPHPTKAPVATNSTQTGMPGRIPLYDYGADAADLTQVVVARGHCDFMRVSDFSTSRAVDSDNERNIVVTADLRVAWRRVGFAVEPEQVLQSVRAVPTP